MSPRKGSNRIKGNARRAQAETGRSYTAALRESAPVQGRSPASDDYLRLASIPRINLRDVTLEEFLRAADEVERITTKVREREAIMEPSGLAISTLRFNASFETITRGGVLGVTLTRIMRASEGVEPLVANRDPSSRDEVVGLLESPSDSDLLPPDTFTDDGALWIITSSEIGGDFATGFQRIGREVRVIQLGGDLTTVSGEEARLVEKALGTIRDGMALSPSPLERFSKAVGEMDPDSSLVTPRGLIIINGRFSPWAAFISRYTASVESEVGEMKTVVEVVRAAPSHSSASYFLDLPDRRHAVSSSDLNALATSPWASGVMDDELSQSEDILWMTRTTVIQLRGGEVTDEVTTVRTGHGSGDALSDGADLDAGIFDTLSSMP